MSGPNERRGGPKRDAVLTHRFQMMFSPEEVAAIDEWRWTNRVPGRAEAIRQLVKLGLGVFGDGYLSSMEAERDDALRAAVEAVIPLEAIIASGTDKLHCAEVQEGIRNGIQRVREAVHAYAKPSSNEAESR